LPIGSIVRALEGAGFRGWYDVQVLCERAWNENYEALIADCRQGLEGLHRELFAQPDAHAAPPVTVRAVEGSAAGPIVAGPAAASL
jgi:hypothetical protein